MKKNVSIVVPVYNERNTIERVIERVTAQPFVHELIIVDDGSSDGTTALLQDVEDGFTRVFFHNENRGKTKAITTALEHVTGEIVVIQDADLEYDPSELIFLCSPIWDGQADVVYGSRFMVRKASRVVYFYHYLGNKFITFLSNVFTNKNMSDVETCYKAFRSFLLTRMTISSSGFGFEVEVTAKVCKTDAVIYETPISYYGRTFEQGKKISYWDGVYALWYILKFNLLPDANTRRYVESCNETLGSAD